MIRKSHINDVAEVEKIYHKLLDSNATRAMTGWQKNVYPSYQTALDAHHGGELFVMEIAGEIVAAAIINQKQVPEYADCTWACNPPDSEIMVIHTLVVDPEKSGKGYATDFVSFYEGYALQNNCKYLRLDTNKNNAAARKLYQKLGYREAGIVPCVFNGIEGVQLVCLEKKLDG
jgi:ribosomal protein S18 acetylase RimI-like enzyme